MRVTTLMKQDQTGTQDVIHATLREIAHPIVQFLDEPQEILLRPNLRRDLRAPAIRLLPMRTTLNSGISSLGITART